MDTDERIGIQPPAGVPRQQHPTPNSKYRDGKRFLPFGVLALILSSFVVLGGCSSLTGFLFQESSDDRPARISVHSQVTPVSPPTSPTDGNTVGPAKGGSTPRPIALALASQARQPVSVPTRDIRDLALRLRPGVDFIPETVPAPNYTVGDRLPFWVANVDNNEHFQVEAELLHKNDVVYVWAERGHDLDLDAMAASADRFAKNIYPQVRAFFGTEANPGIDADPRLHILHATSLGRGIAGYFSSADAFSSLANPFSNQKEMFTISLDWLLQLNDFELYETVLAHEFQHMVHWNNDRNEETWVNEGMSELAQEVAGYLPDLGFARVYARQPGTQLTTWNTDPNDNGRHYGAAYLFMAYFLQRFGEEMTRAVVSQPDNGTQGFDSALRKAGLDLTFEDVFADWTIANYVSDFDALAKHGIYGYRQLQAPVPALDKSAQRLSQNTWKGSVRNFGVDYIALRERGDASVYFQGNTLTRYANVEHFSGNHAWWSNRTDDSDVRLTRAFDFSDVPVNDSLTMNVRMWFDIEEDYDYGYVLASRDGRKWDILSGQRATTQNPSGNSFGPAYTALSATSPGAAEPDWVQESFDLRAYAGEKVFLRFEYVTDDAVNAPGWFVDEIEIPAIGYATNWENGVDGWESEGWLLTDNRLPQEWLVQIMVFQDDRLVSFERAPVEADGTVHIDVEGLDRRSEVVLAISGLTPVTTEEAFYEYRIEQRQEP